MDGKRGPWLEKELNYLKYVGGEYFEEETESELSKNWRNYVKNNYNMITHIKRKNVEGLEHVIHMDK
jgi:hypothetical protein